MAQPKGRGRPAGHSKKGHAGCSCGWKPPAAMTPTKQMAERGRHLIDVRMAAAE